MKNIVKCMLLIAVSICLGFAVYIFSTFSLFFGSRTFQKGGLTYQPHNILNFCFVSTYHWPEGQTEAELVIPDYCGKYKVTDLGGFVGSGAPCPFIVEPSFAFLHYAEKEVVPQDAQILQYVLNLSIGKYVKDDSFIMMDTFFCTGENQYVQILVNVECDQENRYLYAENGRLYRRSDGSLVEEFCYYTDYTQQ